MTFGASLSPATASPAEVSPPIAVSIAAVSLALTLSVLAFDDTPSSMATSVATDQLAFPI
jgi:hypothetical protein